MKYSTEILSNNLIGFLLFKEQDKSYLFCYINIENEQFPEINIKGDIQF